VVIIKEGINEKRYREGEEEKLEGQDE